MCEYVCVCAWCVRVHACVCVCVHMPQFPPLQCRHVRHGLDCCVAQGQGRTCPTSRGHCPNYRTQTGGEGNGGEEGEREGEERGGGGGHRRRGRR